MKRNTGHETPHRNAHILHMSSAISQMSASLIFAFIDVFTYLLQQIWSQYKGL